MAIKKTQMYRKNLDTSETNLYPLTEAQYVSMENGQTVQKVLSDRDSDKYTPVITNSSSTFKVGQGDSVDLSSSMKEGAYESMVLKGKSMVNCIQESSRQDVVLPYEFEDGQYVTINDTKESGALGIELKGQTLVNLQQKGVGWNINGSEDNPNSNASYRSDEGFPLSKLKPNTKYLVKFSKDISATYGSFYFVQGTQASWTIQSGGWGIVTTKSELTSSATGIHVYPRKSNGVTAESLQDVHVMIIEYVDGMEHWDIPYFEGMTSCKMPILKSVGKNLFNCTNVEDINNSYTVVNMNNKNYITTDTLVEKGRQYTLSLHANISGATGNVLSLGYMNYSNIVGGVEKASHNIITIDSVVDKTTSITFTAQTTDYIKIYIATGKVGYNVVLSNVQIEEGSNTTSYEAHKTSILSLPEEVVLRGIGDIKDTLNLTTGELTQAVYEYTFTGDEAWGIAGGNSGGYSYFNCYANQLPVNFDYGNGANVPLTCNTLPIVNYTDFDNRLKNVGINLTYSVRLNFRDCDSNNGATVEDLKAYLKANPTTIQYPISKSVKAVDLKVVDQNGSVIPTLKSWNTTTHIYSEIPENSLHPILSHSNPTYSVILKPSTKYSIVANSYSNNHTNSTINFNLGGATASTTVGSRVTTITTPSTLSNELLTMSGRGNKLNNVMVIEGDVVGDEPYFEGICDCKSPILSNVGKNLFDGNLINGYYEDGTLNKIIGDNANLYKTIKLNLKKGTYTFSFEESVRFIRQLKDGVYNTFGGDFTKFTTTLNTDGIYVLSFRKTDNTDFDLTKIQIEEGSVATAYEPYKTNILSFNQKDDKTIVLRSLPNGVCDTLNVETGEYVQRIGEVVLDGSKTMSVTYADASDRTTLLANVVIANMKIVGENDINDLNVDKMTSEPHSIWSKNVEGVHNKNQSIYVSILKSRLVSNNWSGVQQWLSQNPITVQYELATPIVSTIDVQGFPYAYTNGHVQLSSGHSGQSLTPKVEYSLSANKTGQIDSNTRQVVRQQNKLDDLEALMLTAMIQSLYDKAILQFDYEMQMMSLGGE